MTVVENYTIINANSAELTQSDDSDVTTLFYFILFVCVCVCVCACVRACVFVLFCLFVF